MPTIATIGHLKIRIFADDHSPPHFHIVTPDYEALVLISSLEIICGSLPRSDYQKAREWAIQNKKVLDHEWKRLNER
jgi:hypothetical protein